MESSPFAVGVTVILDASRPVTVDATQTVLQPEALLFWNVYKFFDLKISNAINLGYVTFCWDGGPQDVWDEFLDIMTPFSVVA